MTLIIKAGIVLGVPSAVAAISATAATIANKLGSLSRS